MTFKVLVIYHLLQFLDELRDFFFIIFFIKQDFSRFNFLGDGYFVVLGICFFIEMWVAP